MIRFPHRFIFKHLPCYFSVFLIALGVFILPSNVTAEKLPLSALPVKKQIKKIKRSPSVGQIQKLLEARNMEVAQGLGDAWGDSEWGKTLGSLVYLFDGSYNLALSSATAELPPDAKWLKFYLDDLLKIQLDFVSHETKHFVVSGSERDSLILEYALECMEKAYRVLGDILGIKPEDMIRVEIYPTRETFSAASTLSMETLERSGAIAIAKFNRLMILSPRALPFGYRWQDTLTHEYTHLLINRLSGSNCPLWLHEGIARYMDTYWRSDPPIFLIPASENQLAVAVSSGTLIPFSRMEPSMVYLDNQEQVSLAFSEVSHAVHYITQEYGRDSVSRLLEAFKNEPRSKVFKLGLGVDEEEFEKNWRISLEKEEFRRTSGAILDVKHLGSNDEIDEFVGADNRGLVRLGDKFRRQKRYSVALIQYKKALKDEPDNPVLLNKLAQTYLGLGRQKDAEEALVKSIDKNPNYVTTRVLLGKLLYDDGRYSEALKELREANALNPFHPEIHDRLYQIYIDLGHLELAEREIRAAGQIMPHDPEIPNMLASVRQYLSEKAYRKCRRSYSKGQKDRARKLCEKALEWDPHHKQASSLLKKLLISH